MIREAKWMWLGKDGKIHYISMEQYNEIVKMLNKAVDTAVAAGVVGVTMGVAGGNILADTGNPVMEGLQPVIDFIQNLSEPICYGFMVKGFLKYTQGDEEKAKKTIGNAIAGYLGVKFVPKLMALVGGIDF